MADLIVIVGLTAGDDYTSLPAARAAVPADITGTGGNHRIRCRNDQTHSSYSSPACIQDAAHRLIVEAFPGDEVNSLGVGSEIQINNGFVPAVDLNNPFDMLISMKITQLSTGASAPAMTINNAVTSCNLESCFVTGGGGLLVSNGQSFSAEINNTIFADCAGSGVTIGNFAGSLIFNKSTFANNGNDGLEGRAFGVGTVEANDCYSGGNGTLDYENTVNSGDFNASTDTSAPGATTFENRIITDDLINPNGVTPDYNLSPSSTLNTAGSDGGRIGAFLGAVPAAGISATITESGPDFTESINALLSVNISASITESGPSFTESINTTVFSNISANIAESGPLFSESVSATITSIGIQANISELGPDFNESISADITTSLNINASIAEQGPDFTESISSTLTANIDAAIVESGPDFIESISVNVQTNLSASIAENGPDFTESIIATIPIVITVNPRNTRNVQRRSHNVRVVSKSKTKKVR